MPAATGVAGPTGVRTVMNMRASLEALAITALLSLGGCEGVRDAQPEHPGEPSPANWEAPPRGKEFQTDGPTQPRSAPQRPPATGPEGDE